MDCPDSKTVPSTHFNYNTMLVLCGWHSVTKHNIAVYDSKCYSRSNWLWSIWVQSWAQVIHYNWLF